MCVAIPMRLVEISDNTGIVDLNGVSREVGIMLMENLQIGDWVLIHAGYAISKIDEEAAKEILTYFKDINI